MTEFAWISLEGITLVAAAVAALACWRLFGRNAALSSELREKHETLQHAEQLGNIGHWSVDVENEKVHWSDRVFAIHGRPVSKREPPLQHAINYYHEDDRERVQAMVARAIEDGVPFEFSARLVAEDGTEKHVISRGMCGTDLNGQVNRIYGVFIETAHVIELAQFVNDNAGMSVPDRHA